MVTPSKDFLGVGSQRELQSPQSVVSDAKELPEHMADFVGNKLKSTFSCLELCSMDLNGSWSCGLAS